MEEADETGLLRNLMRKIHHRLDKMARLVAGWNIHHGALISSRWKAFNPVLTIVMGYIKQLKYLINHQLINGPWVFESSAGRRQSTFSFRYCVMFLAHNAFSPFTVMPNISALGQLRNMMQSSAALNSLETAKNRWIGDHFTFLQFF